MTDLAIGIIGLIFSLIIGVIALWYSNKRIGEYFADVAAAFRGID